VGVAHKAIRNVPEVPPTLVFTTPPARMSMPEPDQVAETGGTRKRPVAASSGAALNATTGASAAGFATRSAARASGIDTMPITTRAHDRARALRCATAERKRGESVCNGTMTGLLRVTASIFRRAFLVRRTYREVFAGGVQQTERARGRCATIRAVAPLNRVASWSDPKFGPSMK